MLPLTIIIPLLAACGYAVFGWHRLTAWWGAAACAPTAVIAAATATTAAEYLVATIATIATAVMATAPALIANDLADHRTGLRTARVFGVACCGIVVAALGAVLAGPWWLRAVMLLLAVWGCWLLIAARRRPGTTVAAGHIAIVIAAGTAAIIVGLLSGFDSPAGTGAALLGFATLAGVAPWPSWLCHAHRAATTPVATLLSAVVLPAGWYQLWLLRDTMPAAPGLLVAALALLTAAIVAIWAPDIRLLPLSAAISHGGLVTAAAMTATGIRPIFDVMLASGLACTAAWTACGHIVALTGSGRMRQVAGLWRRHRLLAGFTATATGTTLATPIMLAALVTAPLWWWLTAAALYLTCAAAVTVRTVGMLRGDTAGHLAPGTARSLTSNTFVLPAVLGVWALIVVAGAM